VSEVVLDPGAETWNKGNVNLPPAIPGTSISAVSSDNRPNQRVWVYYQQANTKPIEYQLNSDGRWVAGKSDVERVCRGSQCRHETILVCCYSSPLSFSNS
jgi:hypothetical protein